MDLEATASDEEELMKVWVMVLTEMPYSSTSALRQSKKAWTACLEAASGGNVTKSVCYTAEPGTETRTASAPSSASQVSE